VLHVVLALQLVRLKPSKKVSQFTPSLMNVLSVALVRQFAQLVQLKLRNNLNPPRKRGFKFGIGWLTLLDFGDNFVMMTVKV
jgi:hypothetical protein